jgi:hypothetical protein
MQMRFRAISFAVASITIAAVSSFARAEDFDVSPAIGAGNKIVTNAFQDGAEAEIKNVRVFPYAFGEEETQPYFLSDPGFHPLPGVSGFAGGSLIGFNLLAPLRYWSGTGSPSFSAVGTGDSLRFEFGSSAVTSTGGGIPSPSGFGFGVIEPSGEFDDHLSTYLLAPSGTIANPGMPTEGIYLVAMSLTSDQAGVVPSDPLYLLFSNGATDDAVLAASIYARDTFAAGSVLAVPEPTTTLAAVATLTAFIRRLRSR